MVFPSESITAIYTVRLYAQIQTCYRRGLITTQRHLIMNSTITTATTSNLGVFPPLLPADSFPLPTDSVLGCEGTVSEVPCGTSMLISVTAPELLLS